MNLLVKATLIIKTQAFLFLLAHDFKIKSQLLKGALTGLKVMVRVFPSYFWESKRVGPCIP